MNKLGMAFYIAFCSLDGLMGYYPLHYLAGARTGSLASVDSRLFLVDGRMPVDLSSWGEG